MECSALTQRNLKVCDLVINRLDYVLNSQEVFDEAIRLVLVRSNSKGSASKAKSHSGGKSKDHCVLQ
jgi:hypothetical protein